MSAVKALWHRRDKNFKHHEALKKRGPLKKEHTDKFEKEKMSIHDKYAKLLAQLKKEHPDAVSAFSNIYRHGYKQAKKR